MRVSNEMTTRKFNRWWRGVGSLDQRFHKSLVQARQAVKDARATGQPLPRRSSAASARESEIRCFLCRGPPLSRDCSDRNKTPGKGSRGPRENTQGKKGIGKGEGLGAVTIATAFIVLAGSEIRFVSNAEETHDLNASGDDHNPFDVYSPPKQLCPNNVSVRMEPVASSYDRSPFVYLARKCFGVSTKGSSI